MKYPVPGRRLLAVGGVLAAVGLSEAAIIVCAECDAVTLPVAVAEADLRWVSRYFLLRCLNVSVEKQTQMNTESCLHRCHASSY